MLKATLTATLSKLARPQHQLLIITLLASELGVILAVINTVITTLHECGHFNSLFGLSIQQPNNPLPPEICDGTLLGYHWLYQLKEVIFPENPLITVGIVATLIYPTSEGSNMFLANMMLKHQAEKARAEGHAEGHAKGEAQGRTAERAKLETQFMDWYETNKDQIHVSPPQFDSNSATPY